MNQFFPIQLNNFSFLLKYFTLKIVLIDKNLKVVFFSKDEKEEILFHGKMFEI